MKFLLPLLFFVSIGYSQTLPITKDYIDFSGGLNTYTASVYIKPNESPDLMNVVIDEPLGSISQRNGYQVCGSIPSGNAITNLFEYVKINGSRNLIVTDNVTIWQTSDCQIFTQIATGRYAYSVPRFANVRDNVWITNGHDSPIVWNGTTASILDGAGGRPNAPVAKYIAWWQNRVWLGNTPTEPSAVVFSKIATIEGTALDPATDPAAWTDATLQIYVNRGDGSQLYGMKVYRSNLFLIKETGISRLDFQSEYNLNVVKNVTTIGSKFNESFVEMDDGFLRYAGRDGTYKFDGVTPIRTSTKWNSVYKSIQQPYSFVENFRNWASVASFNRGVGVNVSTLSAANEISMYQVNSVGPNLGAELGDNTNVTNAGFDNVSTEYNWGSRSWKTNIRDTGNLYPSITVKLYKIDDTLLASCNNLPGDTPGVWKSYNCSALTADIGAQIKVVISYLVNFTVDEGVLTYTQVIPGVTHSGANSFVGITYATMYKGGAGSNYVYFDVDESPLASPLTGTFTSEPYHAVGLTKWGAFDVIQTLNSATIAYQVRTGATASALASASYYSITPGAAPSGTDTWIQWTSGWSTTNRLDSPRLSSVKLNWWTGFNIKSLLSGINYKGRYWMTACKTPNQDYNDIVMVESKSPIQSHTRYDLPISAFTIWNDHLYGAIGNTAKIARLDYGTTDDGVAITSYWNSRDEVYDAPLYFKSVNRAIVDYSSLSGNTNVLIGLSNDFGSTYQELPVNLSLSTNPRNTKNINFNANRDLQFRTRIFNDTLGLGFTMYGLHTYGTANQFMGN